MVCVTDGKPFVCQGNQSALLGAFERKVETMNDQHIKDELIKNNHEYRKLWEQHQAFEKRLQQIGNKPYPSEEESLEIPVLKKKKLALKDQMQSMIAAYRKKATAPLKA